jgi:hypothetical protein
LMFIPAAICFIGILLLAVPVRRSDRKPKTPSDQTGTDISVDQDAGDVDDTLTGVEAGQINGPAKISAKQRARKVAGKMIGVKIDKIGGDRG